MNEYIRENKRPILLLTTLFSLLVIVLFFAVLRPILAEFSSKEVAIVEQKDRVELLKAKIKNIEEAEIDIEQLALEDKIPLERNLDEYILSLQQLEEVTESKIARIEFVYDSNLEQIEDEEEIAEKEEAEELTDNTEEAEEAESETDSLDETPSIDPEIIKEKPEELQVMTVRIAATSPDFDKFIELLEIIENKERISIVSKLHFDHPTEEDILLAEGSEESISFEAELTTFYYEK